MSESRGDGALPFREIVEAAAVGITIAAPVTDARRTIVDFRYEYANRRGAEILRRRPEEIVGHTMVELGIVRPGGILDRYVEAFEQGTVFSGIVDVRDDAGARWYDLVAQPMADRLVVTFDNVTEHVETRERERRAHERLAAAFARVPGAVYRFDRELRITFVDADAERLFGIPADEIVGRPLTEVYPDFDGAHLALLRQAIDFGEPTGFDRYVAEPVKGWYTVRAVPDAEGLTAYVTPLEPLLDLERRVAQVERLESVATLAGGIAHDFNNLIMVMGGHASLLAADLGSDHPSAEDVAAIVDASRRAAELTAQLLSFSRQQVIEPVTVDLGAVVEQRVDAWRGSAPAGVALECVVAPEPVLVRVDPVELERVLDHVLRNAVEAVGDAGRVMVETVRSEVTRGSHAADPDVRPGWYGVVTITDDGVGMDPDTLARAPEPFFTTKPRAGSSGLGLSVAHGAARQAGGRLALSSELGVGTTVRLYLPVAVGEPVGVTRGRERGADGTASPPSGTESVLVVDDNASVRALTARILSDLGYDVVTAPDAARALELLESGERPVDLLVADVVMPGLSGYELAAAVHERVGPRPVLYLSGFDERHRGVGSDPAIRADFLRKPFAPLELATRVRRLLGDGAG